MYCITNLSIWCFLAVLPGFVATLGPTYLIAAPNVIRVGVDETVLINILGGIGEDVTFPVTITLKDYPGGSTIYNTTTVDVSKREPVITHVRVGPEHVAYTTGAPQYVGLHASSTSPSFSFTNSTPILLSFKAGHVFIQTDKPIYTPKDTAGVYIRLIAVDEQMLPSSNKVRLDVMTPHARIIERYDDIDPTDGFISKTFNLPPNPVLGNWSVVAFYGHEYKHNSTIQFLVKEYILPKFYVNIKLSVNGNHHRTYILSDDTTVSTLVTATYVFKKPVHGACRIIYHMMDPDGETEVVEEFNTTLTEHGQCSHEANIDELFGNTVFVDNIDRRLRVEAFVLNGVSGKIESSTNSSLKFVDSPFEIKTDKTLKYFKTGFAFDVKIDLIDHNGYPVPNTKVQVTASGDWAHGPETRTTDPNGFVPFRFNIPAQDSINSITIDVDTVAEGQLSNHQRNISFSVSKYTTNGNNGLLVQPQVSASSVVKISENGLDVTLQITNDQSGSVQQVFLFVVAGGKILEPRTSNNVIEGTTLTVPITHDMVPSARLVAFFVSNQNRLEADSLWIDVEDICKNDIEITVPLNDGKTYYEPGQSVTVNVKAKPQTTIKMLGVDSAVYLLQDYHRLTKKKMFSRMAGYDLGCGPGRGSDIADVFKNAGITILTNSEYTSDAETRTDLGCEENGLRRKRSNDETLEELMASYEWSVSLIQYCRKGSLLSSYRSCTQRVQSMMRREGLTEEDERLDAFERCCIAASRASGRSGSPFAMNVDFTSTNIIERTHFPESWMYQNVDITMGDNTETSGQFQLPHSITTWIVQAVGVSPLYGMCVADNKEIVVRSDVFLDVTMPYSVKRFEQVAIVATVYNYGRKSVFGNGELEAQLWMADVEGLCSSSVETPHGAYAKGSVTVPLNSAKSYTFIVVPLETGDFRINMYMFSTPREELVTKTLRVDPEGVLNRVTRSVLLNPAGTETDHLDIPGTATTGTTVSSQDGNVKITETKVPADRIQSDFIQIQMPNDAIQESTSCQLSVIGGLMGPVANASVQGLNVEDILRMPYGCPEQTLSSTAPNVYLYKYVKSVNQVTASIEGESYQHMKDGLARMHNEDYIKADGSYYNDVWLTAYALKIYCKATEFVPAIDETFICDGITWLTGNQNSDGSFQSRVWFSGYVIDGVWVNGGFQSSAWVTAYVISALFECSCTTINLKQYLDSASSFLEGQLPSISNTSRDLAITTYALALMNSTQKDIANNHLQGFIQNDQYVGKFLPYPVPAEEIEITAYALLAQIKLKNLDYGFSLVQWLTQNRNDMGAWYSTRDTIVGLEALTEYALATQQDETNLRCTVTAEQPLADWYIEPENLLVLRAAKTPIGDIVVVKTEGVGLATLSVNLTYNTAAKTEDDLCPFEVNITSKELIPFEVESAVENEEESTRMEIEVCARYLDGDSTDMAIIDVGLMSGFTPLKDSLVQAREIPLIDIVSTADQAVIFYAQKIPGGDGANPLCVSFEAEQKPKVRNVQPAPVKVYDYYNPDKTCLKFYSANNSTSLVATILGDDMRICAAAPCYDQPTRDWVNMDQNEVRKTAKDKVCAGTEFFAYDAVVRKEEKEIDSVYDIYTLEITVLKNGLDVSLQDAIQNRTFLKNKNCDHPVLKVGQRYLVLGRMNTRYDGDWKSYRYIFDSNYDVYEWPTLLAECRAKCNGDIACEERKTKCRDGAVTKNSPRYQIVAGIRTTLLQGCDQ